MKTEKKILRRLETLYLRPTGSFYVHNNMVLAPLRKRDGPVRIGVVCSVNSPFWNNIEAELLKGTPCPKT